MKVIIEKDGVKTHSVNDKAVISHGIAPKTELSKKCGGTLEKKQSHTVGSSEKSELMPRGSPSAAARWKKRFGKKRPKLVSHKKYKILTNGVVGNEKLTKRKERIIYSQVAEKLENQKPRMIQNRKAVSDHQSGLTQTAIGRDSFKNSMQRKVQSRKLSLNHHQGELTQMAMGSGLRKNGNKLKKLAPMSVSGTKKVYRIVKKPAEVLKREFCTKSSKEETGTEAAKLGLRVHDYAVSGVKTAVSTGVKTARKSAKIAKRVDRKLHKTTSTELRRTIRKRATRGKLAIQINTPARQAVRKGTKAAGKTAVNVAKKTAQAAAKAERATVKAIAGAMTRTVGLIAGTAPWSFIVIAVIVLILVITMMFGSLFGSMGGSVAGGGAWLVDDHSSETPEEIYEGYKEFVEQAKDVMEAQAKDALKDKVSSFCSSDTDSPRKIIQYIDKSHNSTFYPASGSDSTINSFIDEFGMDDYADYMSLLFVLMTREKQQADGVTDAEVYDFDFKREDFEEFMKSVNENSCRFGDTFVIKTAVETSPHACPGQNCKRKTISGCKCASYTDDEGKVHGYCKGHPYCPVNHTKLTVKLYTVKDFYGKEYSEIYNFTDNEKARYEASKAMIQSMIDYWEDGNG